MHAHSSQMKEKGTQVLQKSRPYYRPDPIVSVPIFFFNEKCVPMSQYSVKNVPIKSVFSSLATQPTSVSKGRLSLSLTVTHLRAAATTRDTLEHTRRLENKAREEKD